MGIFQPEDIDELEATKEMNWNIGEVLRENSLLEKVLIWHTFKENLYKCPICEKEFQEGDITIGYGIPIHIECFKKLSRTKKKE
jgi:hypothetical protein